jgi:hypothetical protein
MNAEDGAAGLEEPISDAPDVPSAATLAALMVATPTLAYADFAAAVKDALRDAHSPDLLARNPLLRDGLCNLGLSAGPQELRALLCETVGTLFGNPRDEKLRRLLELTYSQSALKQEAVADRLSLSFGTYRRHLTTARERMTRWLWENSRTPVQPELPATARQATTGASPEGEAATAPETGETRAAAALPGGPALRQHRRQRGRRSLCRRHHRNADDGSLAVLWRFRDLSQRGFCL